MSHVRNVRGLLGTKLGMTQLWTRTTGSSR